ncbi:MAG: hypothetical protein QXJ75_04590 [Candidatus Bathyarchaeia archaeon]
MSQNTESEGGFPYATLLLVLIGISSAFLLARGIDAYIGGQTANAITYLIMGSFGVAFIIIMATRTTSIFSTPPTRVTLTLIQCTSCAFKSVRNFQIGDYVPKPSGTCPSCGGPSIIEAIYSEERGHTKKRE